jgi:endonuclease/exonuclease/phosphatase (EEP) superfamily protein YafD
MAYTRSPPGARSAPRPARFIVRCEPDPVSTTKEPSRLRRRIARAVAITAWAYAASLAAASASLHLLADRFWPVTALLFGPRWMLVLPLPAIALASALLVRPWRAATLPVALAALLAAGPLLDARLPIGRVLAAPLAHAAGGELRVLTHNMGGNAIGENELRALLEEERPDIAALQECNVDIEAFARMTKPPSRPGTPDAAAWHAFSDPALCLLSRFPIVSSASSERSQFWDRGGSGCVNRLEIDAPFGKLVFVNLHLATPRAAIDAFLGDRLGAGPGVLANIALRMDESRTARTFLGDDLAGAIIAGDFNLAVESAVYKTYWSDFGNAFSSTGFGLGHTKQTRWFGVRIDHVLYGDRWTAVRAWLAKPTGSDHVPLVADLRRRE